LMKGEVGVDPRGGRSLMRGREGISEVERVSREGSRAHLLFLPLTEQPFQSLDRLHLDITIQQRCSGNKDIEADASENGESRSVGFLQDDEKYVPRQANSRRRRRRRRLNELQRKKR